MAADYWTQTKGGYSTPISGGHLRLMQLKRLQVLEFVPTIKEETYLSKDIILYRPNTGKIVPFGDRSIFLKHSERITGALGLPDHAKKGLVELLKGLEQQQGSHPFN